MSNEVDVVIPTRDRPVQLARCLSALANQTFDRFGVIVVDDGGTASAERLAPNAVRRAIATRWVRNDAPVGAGTSRNRGVALSQAPYVVFLDDDCVPAPEVIARHHRALASAAGPVVSLGPILAPPRHRLPVWTHWDADRLQREYARLNSGQRRPRWTHLYTGNVGVRRSDFTAVGGFDHRFTRQEDIELGYRLACLGCRFTFDPAAVVWHHSDRALRTWTQIPASSAHFDVLMDRLIPGSARLAEVHAGLDAKHWALRLIRRVARGRLAQRCTVTGAIGAGAALHALRADRAALWAFSVVWDLTYSRALAEATAGGTPR